MFPPRLNLRLTQDCRFQEWVDFKRGLKSYQPFKGCRPKKGKLFLLEGMEGFKHPFSLCLDDEKQFYCFIVLDTLSGNVRDLSPQKMSKNNTPYFVKNLQVELGDLRRVVCFSKQRYELFRKFNNSDTEGVVIKRYFYI